MNYSDALVTGNGVTLSEALSEGLKVTGTGLAIVFGVLIILMIVLMLFKVIFYKDPAKQTKAEPVQAAAPAPATAPAEEDVDEAELIAVLTAAVAASLNTSTYNLQIKSYRRIDSKRPAWNKAGVRETINSRF
jgi:sodium pump decarboxylase gamma subunit